MKQKPSLRLFWVVWLQVVTVVAIGCLIQLFGCASLPAGSKRGDFQIVAQHRLYQTYAEWEASPWYRLRDSMSMTPVSLLVSEQGYGCVVEPGEWVLAQERVRYDCKSGWRAPRRR